MCSTEEQKSFETWGWIWWHNHAPPVIQYQTQSNRFVEEKMEINSSGQPLVSAHQYALLSLSFQVNVCDFWTQALMKSALGRGLASTGLMGTPVNAGAPSGNVWTLFNQRHTLLLFRKCLCDLTAVAWVARLYSEVHCIQRGRTKKNTITNNHSW